MFFSILLLFGESFVAVYVHLQVWVCSDTYWFDDVLALCLLLGIICVSGRKDSQYNIVFYTAYNRKIV